MRLLAASAYASLNPEISALMRWRIGGACDETVVHPAVAKTATIAASSGFMRLSRGGKLATDPGHATGLSLAARSDVHQA
jgi:hypothetical protein